MILRFIIVSLTFGVEDRRTILIVFQMNSLIWVKKKERFEISLSKYYLINITF